MPFPVVLVQLWSVDRQLRQAGSAAEIATQFCSCFDGGGAVRKQVGLGLRDTVLLFAHQGVISVLVAGPNLKHCLRHGGSSLRREAYGTGMQCLRCIDRARPEDLKADSFCSRFERGRDGCNGK